MDNTGLIPSGCADFDAVRAAVRQNPTTADNAQYRALILKMWLGALQQQGANVSSFYALDNEYFTLERLVNAGDNTAAADMNNWVDRAFRKMEEIQQSFFEKGPQFTPFEAKNADENTADAGDESSNESRKNWPMFQGDISNTGSIDAPGARIGREAWKFPISLGWYSRPLIEDDRLYVSSPGMRTTCFCLEADSGEVIWKSGQLHPIFGIYKYPAIMSTPISIDNQIVLREINSHGGNEGQARNLVYLDKETGETIARRYAGHIDYRTQYAPVATNGKYTVYPFGVQDIYSTPAICQNLNRLVCADGHNTKKLWDNNVGDIDILAEPVMNETTVFQGTTDNYLYALNLETGETIWNFQTGAPINTSVVNLDSQVLFGANDGKCYALNEADGSVIWEAELEEPHQSARKQFTTFEIDGDRILVGSSWSKLYCLNRFDGQVIWSAAMPDWVRAKPAVLAGKVFAACLNGSLVCLDKEGFVLWEKNISNHPILADITTRKDYMYISDGNLRFYCIDTAGDVVWEKTLLESFTDADSRVIYSDTLSGGTYYQSKPTTMNGNIYFGTHAGLLYAADADTGKELWKFEMGGGISVGAACYDGKIFAGQQGGERFFYCLDAEDGSLIWKKSVPGGWVWGSATVDEGMLYIPTVDGHAVCMEAETGNIVWMFRTAKSIPAEPAVDGDMVYFGSWSKSIYAFDKKTGDIKWKQNCARLDSGTLIAYQGKIYLPHHKNIFMSLDAKTGDVICSGNHNEQEKGDYSDFNATPCFKGNKAYFSTRAGLGLVGIPVYTKLYCIDPENADIHWIYPDGGGLSAPAVAANHLYIASGNMPYLHCLNPETGEPIWIYRMGHRMEEATLCIYGRFLYALSSDGFLHAII